MRPIYLDVTQCATKGGRSGIPRMCRELLRALERADGAHGEVRPLVWENRAGSFARPHRFQRRNLDPRATGTIRRKRATVPFWQRWWQAWTRPLRCRSGAGLSGGWIVLAETFADGRIEWIRRFDRARDGFRLGAIFYDAIGQTHPDWIPAQNRKRFAEYLAALARCDLVLCISRQSRDDLERFWAEQGLSPAPTRVIHCPATDLLSLRDAAVPASPGRPFLLYVATLEPRKNHRSLLAACRALWEQGLDFGLVLVGQRLHRGSEEILGEIVALQGAGFPVDWRREIDDSSLASLYRGCLFTVYPSLKEGFGLPILESLSYGKACLCDASGAIAEAAEGGGCLQVDVANSVALAGGIRTLLESPPERERLEAEAMGRRLATWNDYAVQFLRAVDAA